MSAARPIPTSVILLALTAIAALGFWNGWRNSYYASGGIKNCVAGPSSITGPGGAPVPLATPMTEQPVAQEEIKPAEPPKKKPDSPKAADPGTQTHDLTPLPVKPAVKPPAEAAPDTPPPSKPPPAPGPDEPPY